MNILVWLALQATSIILILLFFRKYKVKQKKALERELSLYNLEQRKELELQKKKVLEDIAKQQAQVDVLVEDYKQSRIKNIDTEMVDYLDLVKGQVAVILSEVENKKLIIKQSEDEIEQLRRTQESIIEGLSRKALENEQYCLNISESDALEIDELKQVASKYGRIRPIILKAIYEIYYAPEVKKLVNRIVGTERVSGIYRITCKIDGRTYIGKSVDIRERWFTHFKRAAGVETETQNLLYPAMRAIGLEQFSFEIVERDVPDSMLTTREKYWQSFYDAKGHGFSVR